MLISIGELLVDIFDDGNSKVALPGGAPFNVACNALLYTRDVSFVGAIGKDEYGKLLLDFARSKSFKKLYIKELSDHYTSKAIVTLDHGERSFKFDRDADYRLSIDDINFNDIHDKDIVHLGSLMLSFKEGVTFYKEAIKRIKAISKAKISFDINYRSDIFKSQDEAKKVFIDALALADIIKFSLEDIELLMGTSDVEQALASLLNENQIAVVSLGSDGSMYYKNGHIVKAETHKLTPIDTTGAGDAFYSYFLASLVNEPTLVNSDERIRHYLLRANVAGGLTTLKKGAINAAPTEEEIDSYLASF